MPQNYSSPKGAVPQNKNLAQITMVPAEHGGTNGVRHENQKKRSAGKFTDGIKIKEFQSVKDAIYGYFDVKES